jgi:hypothetical protein
MVGTACRATTSPLTASATTASPDCKIPPTRSRESHPTASATMPVSTSRTVSSVARSRMRMPIRALVPGAEMPSAIRPPSGETLQVSWYSPISARPPPGPQRAPVERAPRPFQPRPTG